MDERYAKEIRERCSSSDPELNGCELDLIVVELLKELGMPQTIEAFNDVDCWRS